MNRTGCAVLVFATLLLVKSSAIPLQGRLNGQTINNVRFNDADYDDGPLFDPSDEASRCAKAKKTTTFCERLNNYPAAEFKSILKETVHTYETLFGNDVIKPISIETRFAEFEDEEPVCSYRKRRVYPQAGLTPDNTWRYIVNQRNFTQGVSVVECISTIPSDIIQMANGYMAKCKQNYVYWPFVAIGKDGNLTKELIKIPSCCELVKLAKT